MRILGMKGKSILWTGDKTKNVNDNLQKRNILIEKKKKKTSDLWPCIVVFSGGRLAKLPRADPPATESKRRNM